jgi:hypothetical protein
LEAQGFGLFAQAFLVVLVSGLPEGTHSRRRLGQFHTHVGGYIPLNATTKTSAWKRKDHQLPCGFQ